MLHMVAYMLNPVHAFDPDHDTLPLEHFEPLVRRITATARL